MIQFLGQFMGVSVLTVYGGTSYSQQLSQLRRGVQVVVGTSGRILDLIKRNLQRSHPEKQRDDNYDC